MFGLEQTLTTGVMVPPGGSSIIVDPSVIPNLTLEYKGGLITSSGRQENVGTTSYWYSDTFHSKFLYDATAVQEKTINGIDCFDFDDATNRSMFTDWGAPADPESAPFAMRGIFTNVTVIEMPQLTSGSFVLNNNVTAEPDKWAYVRYTMDASQKIHFWMLAQASSPFTVSPNHVALIAGEKVMVVSTFDYSTKTITAKLKGATASDVVTDYDAGSTGMNLRQLDLQTGNPSINLLEILTYDRILTDDELNKLGAYFTDKWGSSVWVDV